MARGRMIGLVAATGAALAACMPAGYVDITVDLKELNQEIAPAAVFCPELAYPNGAVVECTLEGTSRYAPVSLTVSDAGTSFTDPAKAQAGIEYVTADMPFTQQ